MVGLLTSVLLLAVADSSAQAAGDPSAPASVATAQVTYHEIATFEGYRFPLFEPWSPTGHVLLLTGESGLFALDVDHPEIAPRRVAGPSTGYVAWSPDGSWILGQQTLDPRRPIRRLIAAPISGAGEIEIAADAGHGHVLWGSNGKLYYWSADDHRLVGWDPPESWRRDHPGPFPLVEQFVPAERERGSLMPSLWPLGIRTYPDRQEIDWLALTMVDSTEARVVLIQDTFPGGLLLRVMPSAGDLVAVVADNDGRIRATFHASPTQVRMQSTGSVLALGFIPSTVSSDARYVVGYSSVEDGHMMYESKLQLGDIEGRWVVPIAGAADGEMPHLSRDGWLLAFVGLEDNQVHIGSLDFVWPK